MTFTEAYPQQFQLSVVPAKTHVGKHSTDLLNVNMRN